MSINTTRIIRIAKTTHTTGTSTNTIVCWTEEGGSVAITSVAEGDDVTAGVCVCCDLLRLFLYDRSSGGG